MLPAASTSTASMSCWLTAPFISSRTRLTCMPGNIWRASTTAKWLGRLIEPAVLNESEALVIELKSRHDSLDLELAARILQFAEAADVPPVFVLVARKEIDVLPSSAAASSGRSERLADGEVCDELIAFCPNDIPLGLAGSRAVSEYPLIDPADDRREIDFPQQRQPGNFELTLQFESDMGADAPITHWWHAVARCRSRPLLRRAIGSARNRSTSKPAGPDPPAHRPIVARDQQFLAYIIEVDDVQAHPALQVRQPLGTEGLSRPAGAQETIG